MRLLSNQPVDRRAFLEIGDLRAVHGDDGALGILEQLVVGYVDPQYSLIIALIVMLVLIGWRSRREIASASHEAHAAIQRARVPWPAPVRIGLIVRWSRKVAPVAIEN
jgi:hypothetical protein